MNSLRTCLKEPIVEIYEAAEILSAAVEAHLRNDGRTASQMFAAANMPVVREWTESIWGSGWKKLVQPRTIECAPAYLPKIERQPVRMPTREMEGQIIARDGFHCRFCGIPVIHKSVRERAKKLYPEAVSWGSTNASQHAAFQAMWLQYDHLVPHSRGGSSEFGNVIITCAPCNYGRFHYTIEELELMNPFDREPAISTWNGLMNFL
jgi:hypothetical protein